MSFHMSVHVDFHFLALIVVFSLLFLPGCDNEVHVHLQDQYDEVFCIVDQDDDGFMTCCFEGHTDPKDCWEEAASS